MADDLDDSWWEDDGASVVEEPEYEEKVEEKSLKRKRNTFSGSVNGWQPSLSNPKQPNLLEPRADKKKKKRKKRKTKTEELAENLNPIEPLKEFHKVIKALEQHMTVFERDEFRVDGLSIIQQNLDGDIESTLKTSLARCSGFFSRKTKAAGQPFVLFVTGSAIRAVDLKRNLQNMSSECKIAKLFAKHMKIKDQVSFLSKNFISVAVGTPKRIHELIELNALKLSKLKYILLDWTWRDTKLRRMVEISEVKKELFTLLFKRLFNAAEKYSTQIVLL